MAGSYQHIVNDKGQLLNNENFVGMIENLGDAYEMAEELYGMIWFLATEMIDPLKSSSYSPEMWVEEARKYYKIGLNSYSPGKEI